MMLLNPLCIAQGRSSRRLGSLLLVSLVILAAAGASPDSFAAKRDTDLQVSAGPDSDAKSKPQHIGTMSVDQKNEVQALITRAVRDRLQAAQRNGNAWRIRTVHAYLNQADDMLTIDIKRSEIPARSETIPADILDALDELAKSIIYLLEPDLYVAGYAVTIDGRPASEVMPDLPNPLHEKSPQPATTAAAADEPIVVVSAGHGYRRLFTSNGVQYDWKFQRDPGANGAQEDLLTPFHASELSTWLAVRSNASVEFPRSQSSEAFPNTDNLQAEWWEMAGRYSLESRYPDKPEMWDVYGSATSDIQRDEKSDWYARPNFANYLNAEAIISLHTNGDSSTATRGMTAWAQTGRTDDVALGSSILCYAKEIIHAQEGYESFPVASHALQADKAENREASRPAIIVETGYHTNPDDALALQDDLFVQAAMKGVEKGYRLHKQGKSCVPFAITNIPNVTGPTDYSLIPADVEFAGFPQFPVTRLLEIVSCPSDVSCMHGTQVYSEEVASPLPAPFYCAGFTETKVATFRTTLTDADGVKTGPVEHTLTCAPSSVAAARGTAPKERASMGMVTD